MLLDLEHTIESCRKNYEARAVKGEVRLTDEFKKKFTEYHSGVKEIEYGDFTVLITTDENRKVEFPSSWFWYALDFHPLWTALEAYKELFAEVKKEASKQAKASSSTFPPFKSFLKTLPDKNWKASNNPWIPIIDSAINTVTHSRNDSDLLHKFIAQPEWWNKPVDDSKPDFSYKKLDRTDVYQSSIESATRVLAASASWLYKVIGDFAKHPDLRNCFTSVVSSLSTTLTSSMKAIVGTNKILYGAPGTGKSYKIDSLIKGAGVVRTVFHPDYMYSDFIGALKPSTESDGNISYKFQAGPFIRCLVAATKDPKHQYYLVIEELNRAPAAAVFGDIFQLLDRDNKVGQEGKSKYSITISDPELINYLKVNAPNALTDSELHLPSNLSLLATMNSSDQAVLPLDTAFKRRWEFEYLPLDFSKSCATGDIEIYDNKGNKIVTTWRKFAEAINDKLKNLSSPIPEDRLLGPWFVTSDELKSSPESVLTGKLFSYLWDDVLRHGLATELFRPNIKTYGDLVKAQTEKKPVFNDPFIQTFSGS